MSRDAEFLEAVSQRRRARMSQIDRLPAPIRELVHEYGYNIIKAHLDLKITNPRHIRHLIETTISEFSPTRGSFSSQGTMASGHSLRVIKGAEG